jgi:hypothetical protein
MDARRHGWRGDAAWFLVCALASSAWCVAAAHKLGATADETPYLKMGLERWRTGSYRAFMSAGTMPLAADVQTLPLYLRERWRGTPFDVEPQLPKLLPVARAATLAFWWWLLAHGFLIGRRIAGSWGGRFAVALLAVEPNLLAHAGLATTDVAVSACALALVYHFHRGRERGWCFRVGVPAVCFGLLVLAKASAVVFGPVCLAAVGLSWAAGRSVPRPVRSLILDVPQILLLGFALATAYVGCEWRPSDFLPARVAGLSDGAFRQTLGAYQALPIFPNVTEGILFQVFQNAQGTSAYLFGEVYPHGVWYYFPLALCMKLPLPLFVLPAAVAVVRPRALANWALAAALALLVLSVTYRVQNGVRIVLPLVALGTVGLAAATVAADAGVAGPRRRALAALAAGAVVWTAISGATARPDGLAYFNELWRGRPGYEYLNDSNYDWGQGLRGLDRWHRTHGHPPTLVWTFGNDPSFRTMQVTQYQLDSLNLPTPEEHLAKVRGHYLAVSAIHVYGYWDTSAVQFLRARRPVAQASTYLIYDFRTGE